MLKIISHIVDIQYSILRAILRIFGITFFYFIIVFAIFTIVMLLLIKYQDDTSFIYSISSKYLKYKLDKKGIYLDNYKGKLLYKSGSYYLSFKDLRFYYKGVNGNLDKLLLEFNVRNLFTLHWKKIFIIQGNNLNIYAPLSYKKYSIKRNKYFYNFIIPALIRLVIKSVVMNIENSHVYWKDNKLFLQNINNLDNKKIALNNLTIEVSSEKVNYILSDIRNIFKLYNRRILLSFRQDIFINKFIYLRNNQGTIFRNIIFKMTRNRVNLLRSTLILELQNFDKTFASLKFSCLFPELFGAKCSMDINNLYVNLETNFPQIKEKFKLDSYIGNMGLNITVPDLRNITLIKNINYSISKYSGSLIHKDFYNNYTKNNISIVNAYGYVKGLNLLEKSINNSRNNITALLEKTKVDVVANYKNIASNIKKGNFELLINSKDVVIRDGLHIWEFVNKLLNLKYLTNINKLISLAIKKGSAQTFGLKLIMNKKDGHLSFLKDDDLKISIKTKEVESEFLANLYHTNNLVVEKASNVSVVVNAQKTLVLLENIEVNNNFLDSSLLQIDYKNNEPTIFTLKAHNINSNSSNSFKLLKNFINVGFSNKFTLNEFENTKTISNIDLSMNLLDVKSFKTKEIMLANMLSNISLKVNSKLEQTAGNKKKYFIISFIKEKNNKVANFSAKVFVKKSNILEPNSMIEFKGLMNYNLDKQKNILFNLEELSLKSRNINIHLSVFWKNWFLKNIFLNSYIYNSDLRIHSNNKLDQLSVYSDLLEINKIKWHKIHDYLMQFITPVSTSRSSSENIYKEKVLAAKKYLKSLLGRFENKKLQLNIYLNKIYGFNDVHLHELKGYLKCQMDKLCNKGVIDFQMRNKSNIKKYRKDKDAYALFSLVNITQPNIFLETNNLGLLLASFNISQSFIGGAMVMNTKIKSDNFYSAISIQNLLKLKKNDLVEKLNKVYDKSYRKKTSFLFISEFNSNIELNNYTNLNFKNILAVFKTASLFGKGNLNIITGKLAINGYYNVLYRAYRYFYNIPLLNKLLNKEKGIIKIKYKLKNDNVFKNRNKVIL